MMTIIQSLILGIIQGVTEFLPISSSAHLVIIPRFFGWEEHTTAFDAMLHAGTLFATVIYFRKDLIKLITDRNYKLIGFFALATIPAAFAGLFFADQIDTIFKGDVLIALMLVAVGVFMVLAEQYAKKHKGKTMEDAGLKESLLIGIAQAVALIRGTSRSGVTISTGLFAGLTREEAARFSFILGIPVIAAAGLKSFIDIGGQGDLISLVNIVGLLASAITGYLVVKFFLRYLKNGSLIPFAIYRFILAGLILVLLIL